MVCGSSSLDPEAHSVLQLVRTDIMCMAHPESLHLTLVQSSVFPSIVDLQAPDEPPDLGTGSGNEDGMDMEAGVEPLGSNIDDIEGELYVDDVDGRVV